MMLSFLSALATLLNPVIQPPAPTGPYPVGFGETVLLDRGRTLPSGEPRAVALEVWYPAHDLAGTPPEPYSGPAHNAALSKFQGIPGFLLTVRPSHSYRGARPIDGRRPVVLFNHGYPSYGRQNFSQMQELASQGYVVIALGHPGESLVAMDVGGNFAEIDLESPGYKGFQEAQKDAALPGRIARALHKQRQARTPDELEQAARELTGDTQFTHLKTAFEDWVEDNHFVLHRLAGGDLPDLLKTADPHNAVVMGHSFGGVVAVELGKNPPAGVRGVINLDGPWLLYPDQTQQILKVPALLMPSTQNWFSGQDMGLHGTLSLVAQAASSSVHVLELQGSGHFNFTDLNYFPVLKLFSPVLGDADNSRLGAEVNRVMVEFLNRVFKETLTRSP